MFLGAFGVIVCTHLCYLNLKSDITNLAKISKFQKIMSTLFSQISNNILCSHFYCLSCKCHIIVLAKIIYKSKLSKFLKMMIHCVLVTFEVIIYSHFLLLFDS